MKVYHFTLFVAVADDHDEHSLIERVKRFASGVQGSLLAGPPPGIEAKVTLVYGEPYGAAEPTNPYEWTDEARKAILKAGPADLFEDSRGAKP